MENGFNAFFFYWGSLWGTDKKKNEGRKSRGKKVSSAWGIFLQCVSTEVFLISIHSNLYPAFVIYHKYR
jgi:hypothetical protein